MSMEIFGLNPKSKKGEFFRASAWSARPLFHLLVDLCSNLLDKKTLDKISYNEGGGPEEEETCKKIANHFEKWLEFHANGYVCLEEIRMDSTGKLLERGKRIHESFPAYHISDDDLKQWCEFLRNCGGFKVW